LDKYRYNAGDARALAGAGDAAPDSAACYSIKNSGGGDT